MKTIGSEHRVRVVRHLLVSNPPSDDSDPLSDDYSPDHSNCGFESDLDDDYTLNFEPGESSDNGM